MFRTLPVTLHDCRHHGPGSGAELFVVEGDSASKTVCRARDCRNQAVLPMQGKPMNAIRAGKLAVGRFELFRALIDAIGAGWDDQLELEKMRYEHVILLFDPDADGIHCGALMSMFFHRWMRPLLETGRLSVIRPPHYEIFSPRSKDKLHAYSDRHYQRLRNELDRQGIEYQGQRYRGLASMSDATLVTTCLDPETRNISPLRVEDAEAAIRIFVGDASK
jgi:DNA gyrase/topoisomerase IV subunit B